MSSLQLLLPGAGSALEVQPTATQVARDRGFSLVLLKQPTMLAIAAEVDITAAVIAELKGADAGQASAITPALPGAAGN